MLNAIPILGWCLSLIFSVSLAVPFYFIWNALSLRYFYFLPQQYHDVPFWHLVGLFMIVPILKAMLTPRLAWVDVKTDREKKRN